MSPTVAHASWKSSPTPRFLRLTIFSDCGTLPAMCTVSMIGDHYRDKWMPVYPAPSINIPAVSREEFEALKREILDLKALLKKAKKYDEDNGEPKCEMDTKIAFLKAMAKELGVDLDDIFKS